MPPIVVKDREGRAYEVDETKADELLASGQGFVRETPTEAAERSVETARKAYYSTPGAKVTTALSTFGSTVSGGITDALAGLDPTMGEHFAAGREYNPGYAVAGGVLGGVSGVGVAGLASKAGSAIAKTAEGAGALTKLGRAAAGSATEGAIYGAGQGVSEVSLSDDPLTLDNIVSTIGSNALFGGTVGGVAGLATKGTGLALRKAKGALDDLATKGPAEVDAMAGKAFADDVAKFRKQTVDDTLFLSVRGSADRETKGIAKDWLDADRAVDRALKSPKSIARDPKRVLSALEQQEYAMERVVAKTDELAAKFAADTSGERLAALQKVPAALERNRALQAKITELAAKPAATGGAQSLAKNMLGGQVFGMVSSLASAVPVLGAIPGVAQLAGSIASKVVTGGLEKSLTAQAARVSKALGTVLDVGAKLAPAAPVLASKFMAAVRYSEAPPQPKPKKGQKAKKQPTPKLADSFEARAKELREMTEYDMAGNTVMRPAARMKLGAQLNGVRAADPLLADRIETSLARRYEYLASVLPKAPDIAAMSTGPGPMWRYSDMEMRAWARIAHALEDPIGVVERLGAGMVTPDEAKAFRAVYPELFANIQQQIMAQLPALQQKLPYQKRLALSIFSGVPVDPSLDPRILGVLQAQFEQEPGSEGGTQAPTPEPQFGSVRATEPTAAQAREA